MLKIQYFFQLITQKSKTEMPIKVINSKNTIRKGTEESNNNKNKAAKRNRNENEKQRERLTKIISFLIRKSPKKLTENN